ncbi:tape measure protein [Streptomyces phage BRock]|uniref:Tape measure protein n=1 Tax=Streptomyces phage BRock TaxID=1913591 RepID=A0A1J0GW11_9CAUD|nr:tape measure protein [Streptomyces phage BRock]APC46378.1 tape measure protein [Streptomyces phage BRock]
MYEVGDKLHWISDISFDDEGEDLPMDAVERDAEVTHIDSDGTVYVKFGDGLEEYFHPVNMQDFFERVVS